jgi:3-ketosteroid 9alpha-monooxygenase subunit B
VIFRQELDALARQHPDGLQVVTHLDSESGFAGPAELREALTGFEDAHCYICGPTPFMDLAEQVLADKGVGRGRIAIERFESAADGEAPQVVLSADAEIPSEIVIQLEGQQHQVPYQKGQTILQAARAAGLQPPFACEEGYCGSCAAKRRVGQVAMATNDVFDPDELAEGWVLTCQGQASGPTCEVDYDG